jgi:hypothetical protein
LAHRERQTTTTGCHATSRTATTSWT